MNKDYKIENMVKITDWMVNSELLPIDDNFEKLLKGFIETPGRMVQPSYNFYVRLSLNYLYFIELFKYLIIFSLYLTILHNIKNMTYKIYLYFNLIFLDIQLHVPFIEQYSNSDT